MIVSRMPLAFLSFSVSYLTYLTITSLSQAHPMRGTNVRDATSSDNLTFVVSLGRINHNGEHFCTGSLITRRSVLTCQHCIFEEQKSNIQIIVGSTDRRLGQKYGIADWQSFDQWYYHVKELTNTTEDDIAVIRLDRSVDDPMVKPVPIRYINMMNYPYHFRLRMAGWGIDDDGKHPVILKTSLVELIPTQDCNERGKSIIGDEEFYISNQYFCSNADPWLVNSCGDSGGPTLNENNQLIALTAGAGPIELFSSHVTKEIRDRNLMNNHLNLYPYFRFIESAAIV